MKTLRFLAILAVLSLSISSSFAAGPVDQAENVQARIKESDFVVAICIYEQEWIPATPEFPKARLIQRAVVTGVHKGPIHVGTKIEYYHLIEEPPRFLSHFRSVVEGELRTFFFSADDGTLKDNKYTLEGDAHFGFDRCSGDFADAFKKELQRNPELKNSSEQDGGGQPATRPESK